jgi:hypothetical protein
MAVTGHDMELGTGGEVGCDVDSQSLHTLWQACETKEAQKSAIGEQ